MTRKGIVSTLNNITLKARVIFPDLNNKVSNELTIADYVGNININDVVVISFFDEYMTDGLIIADLSSNSNPKPENNDTTYTHNQISPSVEWAITHNLKKYPSTTVVDSSGNVVVGDINYVSENELIISFQAAFSGIAYLN